MNNMYKWENIEKLNAKIRIQHINPHGFYFVVLRENGTGKETSYKFAYEIQAIRFYESICNCLNIL